MDSPGASVGNWSPTHLLIPVVAGGRGADQWTSTTGGESACTSPKRTFHNPDEGDSCLMGEEDSLSMAVVSARRETCQKKEEEFMANKNTEVPAIPEGQDQQTGSLLTNPMILTSRSRRDSCSSNHSNISTSGNRKRRREEETETGDCKDELDALRDMEKIAQEVRGFLESKQAKSLRVTTEVINTIGENLDEASTIVRKLGLLNAQLKGQIVLLKEQLRTAKNKAPLSYSEAAKQSATIPPVTIQGKKKMLPINKFELLIQPKDAENKLTADEVKTRVASALNPIEDGIQLKNIRRTKKGVIVETAGEKDISKILQNKDLITKGLEAVQLQKRKPRIIIYDVPADYETNDVIEALTNQNDLGGITKQRLQDETTFRFRTGKRNDLTTNWVLEVSPKVRNELRRQEKVYVGLRRCRVMDYSAISRCYKCQGLGHVSTHCREEKETCGHCAMEGHRTKDCKKKSDQAKCALCKRLGRSHEHKPDKDCPTYKMTQEIRRQNTNYG